MIELKNKLILIATAVAAAMGAQARGAGGATLPRDNDAVTVHRTTLLTAGDGQTPVWDFSGAKVTDANLVWRYSWCGDTLLSETRPRIRRDYAVVGDSVSLVCIETCTRRIATPGREAELRHAAGSVAQFSERGRHTQSDSIWGRATLTAAPVVSGTIILPDSDTPIPGATMHRFTIESARLVGRASAAFDSTATYTPWHHREEIIIWRAPGLRYAVAETRVSVDSLPGQPAAVTAESHICPPETQPLELPSTTLTASRPGGIPPLPGTGSEADSNAAVPTEALADVSVTASAESITLAGRSLVGGRAGLTLCDIAGRVYAHSPETTLEPGTDVELTAPRPSDLPPGDYLLRVVTPEATTVAKLILR